ncbi:hypothetical protein TWF694_010774 [Orbilia ellipsospora]|uniref:Uncharacterized protein n=1 Tax=Orbilia ellipsospora TaxID=2528407 RepID=A0AAV9X8E4_9PEZI
MAPTLRFPFLSILIFTQLLTFTIAYNILVLREHRGNWFEGIDRKASSIYGEDREPGKCYITYVNSRKHERAATQIAIYNRPGTTPAKALLFARAHHCPKNPKTPLISPVFLIILDPNDLYGVSLANVTALGEGTSLSRGAYLSVDPDAPGMYSKLLKGIETDRPGIYVWRKDAKFPKAQKHTQRPREYFPGDIIKVPDQNNFLNRLDSSKNTFYMYMRDLVERVLQPLANQNDWVPRLVRSLFQLSGRPESGEIREDQPAQGNTGSVRRGKGVYSNWESMGAREKDILAFLTKTIRENKLSTPIESDEEADYGDEFQPILLPDEKFMPPPKQTRNQKLPWKQRELSVARVPPVDSDRVAPPDLDKTYLPEDDEAPINPNLLISPSLDQIHIPEDGTASIDNIPVASIDFDWSRDLDQIYSPEDEVAPIDKNPVLSSDPREKYLSEDGMPITINVDEDQDISWQDSVESRESQPALRIPNNPENQKNFRIRLFKNGEEISRAMGEQTSPKPLQSNVDDEVLYYFNKGRIEEETASEISHEMPEPWWNELLASDEVLEPPTPKSDVSNLIEKYNRLMGFLGLNNPRITGQPSEQKLEYMLSSLGNLINSTSMGIPELRSGWLRHQNQFSDSGLSPGGQSTRPRRQEGGLAAAPRMAESVAYEAPVSVSVKHRKPLDNLLRREEATGMHMNFEDYLEANYRRNIGSSAYRD